MMMYCPFSVGQVAAEDIYPKSSFYQISFRFDFYTCWLSPWTRMKTGLQMSVKRVMAALRENTNGAAFL